MKTEDAPAFYIDLIRQNADMPQAVAAVQTLVEILKSSHASTLSELRAQMRETIRQLTTADTEFTGTSISSGCELFLRFITLTALDQPNLEECKATMVERGQVFLEKVSKSRQKIAELCNPFIRDGAVILTHAKSRVVIRTLIEAAHKSNKRFQVYVTESGPDYAGREMMEELTKAGISCILILDSAVGYIMEKIDIVLVGAEGVVESGGIINKIGSFTMAVCAKTTNKPVFVLAESFKFVRFYPLNQQDVPNLFKYNASSLVRHADLEREHPRSDYTPPAYITLLFSDIGVLTPSAVSDELIKLYL